MFLTSLMASFIASLTLSGGTLVSSSVGSTTGFGIVNISSNYQYLLHNQINLNYSSTDVNNNSYTMNVFKTYISNNELTYGWNSNNNNVAFSCRYAFSYSGQTTQYVLTPYTSEYYSDQAYDVYDLSSLIASNGWIIYSNVDIIVTFTLLSEVDYNNITDSNEAYNNGYNSGYSIGESQGESTGYSNGYIDGKNDGEDLGYRSGYSTGYYDGQVASGNPSFMGLFASIADTPILMLRSLFNFDLFGIPILTAVLSFMTATMLIWVVKKILK